MRAIFVVLVALAATGCIHQQLTTGGAAVEVVMERPPACQEIGFVIGYGYVNALGEADQPERLADHALVDARNRTAERGGTHFVLVGVEAERGDSQAARARGLAYRCAPAPAAADRSIGR